MLINGEKFACEACVRGHRVSSCHHQDRPLVHVNKKGRPVSQCHHCRGMRKSRASHIKCDCQEKGHSKEDCPHEKGDNKTDHNTCCCQHGPKCTCSVKKDHLDPLVENLPQLAAAKEQHHKRLGAMNSHESKATVFTNGHHKPVHKINDAHNLLGAPYKIPSRSHTVHGHREIAQRSTDSLPLTKITKPAHESPLHMSMTPSEVKRMVKSEHNSPLLGPTSVPRLESSNSNEFRLPAFDPNSYSYSPFGSNSPSGQPNQPELVLPETFPESWFMSYEQAHDYQPPGVSSSHGGPVVDWTNFNIDLNNTLLDPNMNIKREFMPSQSPSFGSLEQFGRLNSGVASSSGDLSEVEEFVPSIHPNPLKAASIDGFNDLGSQGGDDVASDRYRLSSASSYYGTPQANLLAGDNTDSLDIDDFLRQAEAETRKMQMQNQQNQFQQMQQRAVQSPQPSRSSQSPFTPQSNPVLPEHSFTVHEAQKYAHMNETQNRQQRSMNMPVAGMIDDPAWSLAPDMSNPTLNLDDEREDEDWVR